MQGDRVVPLHRRLVAGKPRLRESNRTGTKSWETGSNDCSWQSGGRATINIKRRTTPYEELNCLVWEWFCITLWINTVAFSHIFSCVRFMSHCIQYCHWMLCFILLCMCCGMYAVLCVFWFDIMAHNVRSLSREATRGHFCSEPAVAGGGRYYCTL